MYAIKRINYHVTTPDQAGLPEVVTPTGEV